MPFANYSDLTGRIVGRWSGGGGGGSIPLRVVTIGFADILPNQLGDGSNAAPLATVPARSALTVLGYLVTEAFNDSSVDGVDTLQVVDAADANAFNAWGAATLDTVTVESGPGYFTLGDATTVPTYFPSGGPIFALVNTDWAFDGTTGSVDILLMIQAA